MKTLIRMFEQVRWANRRLLEGLIGLAPVSPQIGKLMAHIIQAERVWLTRLHGNDSNSIELWPELSFEECLQLAGSTAAEYDAYLAALQESDLDRLVSYRNQTGKEYATSIRDILAHVAMHGQYHRGQINVLLRAEGKEPVNVDMIAYVREVAD